MKRLMSILVGSPETHSSKPTVAAWACLAVLAGIFAALVRPLQASDTLTINFTPKAAVSAVDKNGLDLGRIGMNRSAAALLNQKVKDKNDKTVGKLEDLLVHVHSGKVAVALVSSGKTKAAVPAVRFSSASEGLVRIEAERDFIERAPKFSGSLESAGLAGSYNYFGLPAPEGGLALTSVVGLKGASLVANNQEKLGSVADVMLDVSGARILYLVIQPVVGPNPGGNLYLVPPTAVTISGSGLVLDATSAHFLASRVVSKEFPTDMVLPEVAQAIYQHYAGASAGTPTTLAAAAPASTPAKSDTEISRDVLSEILRNADGFVVMNIKIAAKAGVVTLSGSVKTEQEKSTVLTAAGRVPGVEKIQDHLEVKGKVNTARL